MKVTTFVGCVDGSLISPGMVNLSAAGFREYAARQFPCRIDPKYCAMMEHELLEDPGHHTYALLLVGQDRIVARIDGRFETSHRHPGFVLLMNFYGLDFSGPGDYRVDFVLDGKVQGSCPLRIVELTKSVSTSHESK